MQDYRQIMRRVPVSIVSPFGGTMKPEEFHEVKQNGTVVTATNVYIPKIGVKFSVTFSGGDWEKPFDEAVSQLGEPQEKTPSTGGNGITAAWSSCKHEAPIPFAIQTIGQLKFDAIMDQHAIHESETEVVKDLLRIHQMCAGMPLAAVGMEACALCLADLPPNRREAVLLADAAVALAFAKARGAIGKS